MKKIEINSRPSSKKIMALAEWMGVSYTKRGKEYMLELTPPWGKGTISSVDFDNDFGLMMYDCVFYEDVEIRFIENKAQPLKFVYCLDGRFNVGCGNEEEISTMEKYHSAILTTLDTNDHIFSFRSGEPFKVRNIQIDNELFHNRFYCHNEDCESKLQKLFDGRNAKQSFYHDGMYSVTLSDLFKKIDIYPHGGMIRSVFLESIALEVLSEQLSLYEHEGLNKELGKYELACIEKATAIIDDELEDLCTVPILAHRVGLNINKLQKGFKNMYRMTVGQYVHSHRLELATSLLRNSDLNISEIVNKVGLSSKSYFSKIFKDTYGITPSDYKKKIRN